MKSMVIRIIEAWAKLNPVIKITLVFMLIIAFAFGILGSLGKLNEFPVWDFIRG